MLCPGVQTDSQVITVTLETKNKILVFSSLHHFPFSLLVPSLAGFFWNEKVALRFTTTFFRSTRSCHSTVCSERSRVLAFPTALLMVFQDCIVHQTLLLRSLSSPHLILPLHESPFIHPCTMVPQFYYHPCKRIAVSVQKLHY